MFDRDAYHKKVSWYIHDRFGMFIHWGLYAIPARGEWIRSFERISIEDYQPYFDAFDPTDFDPHAWAKTAKQAGMKYAVLTAKHHDGFCLFDSKLTDYKSTNTPCGRDLVQEYLDAFREEGIKVGLYYSLLDWHHPDYPHFGDTHHPMRDNEAFKGAEHHFERYLDYMHGQIEELCTAYGKIDLFWFDFSYDELCGEAWKATELVRMIRRYQPDTLIDSRLEVNGGRFGSLLTDEPVEFSGDFLSPEQIIPPNGICGTDGNPVLWEACITMNNNWGYSATDKNFKPADMIVKKLVECVSKGGNLLINVGPDAKGNIPCESLDILHRVGEWMHRNGDSIYGCDMCTLEKPDFGRITACGNKRYYHLTEAPVGFVPLTGLDPKSIKQVRLLRDGSELRLQDSWITLSYPDLAFVSFGSSPLLPDAIDTVIEVELYA